MGFEVVGVSDDELRGDDGDEGSGGEVTGLFAGEGLEVGFDSVILVVFGADVGVDRGYFLP